MSRGQLSISIDQVASDAIYDGQYEPIFLRKNACLRQRRQKLETSLDAHR